MNKCTACGDCPTVCPVTRANEYDWGLSSRKATYKPYAQAIPGGYCIEKKDRAPCGLACPANLNVQGYVAMVKEGKYREAIEIILEKLPLPGVLGRVCVHQCEKSCRRLEKEEAVSIRELKRVAAEQVDLSGLPIPAIEPNGKHVAVIGSGPSGLTAAYFLALKGYQVRIYEAMPEAGGMLRYCIPTYRLPRSILDAEIAFIQRHGVEILTNTPLGKDLTLDDLLGHGTAAVYLATGAHQGLRMGIPGEDELQGVVDVVSFLRDVHLGKRTQVSGKVVVVGGGHSVLDAAVTSVRMGAKEVHIVYRRSRREMLADQAEVTMAEVAGVKIHFQVAPLRLVGEKGQVIGLECIRTRLMEADSTGRRKPVPIAGSEIFFEAETVISAIGQEPDLRYLGNDSGLAISKWGLLVTNPATLQTNRPDVFAGGDCITGPATAIEAVEAGQRAAHYIDRYLQGLELPQEWEEEPPVRGDWLPIAPDEPIRQRRRIPFIEESKVQRGVSIITQEVINDLATEEADRCLDCGVCCECFQCVSACKAGAVDHSQQEKVHTIEVGAVILAPGFQPYDPSRFDTYEYANHPNVVTSLEYERILSASGPTMGHLVRPSDHKEPKKIAWLHCVGSRDVNHCDHAYCSSVCCMAAIKEAVISKEHSRGDLDCAIFYMDMRTYGKDFERYYERARNESGVRFIRSRIHSITPLGEKEDLAIQYVTESGEITEEVFDLVVLSVGMETPEQVLKIGQTLGIEMDQHGFALTSPARPVATSRPGIYVCGAFQEPKDIPASVMEASAAASEAAAKLSEARNTLIKERSFPEEREVSGQEARIGVFVCNCGINIGGIVRVPEVAAYARNLPGVHYVEENLFTCSQDTQEKMKEVIEKEKLNRIVVAACTPRTHEPLFQETLRDAGLNKYLFEMANIRNQCSWVHNQDPDGATRKAKDLVRMAVTRANLIQPLLQPKLPVTKKALVVGGGVAGLTAALNLADQGFPTHLIEEKDILGGNARHLITTWKGDPIQPLISELIRKVQEHPHLQIHLKTKLKEVQGFLGNFVTTVSNGQGDQVIEHGAMILATGGKEFSPREYLYGQDPRVMTHLELDQAIIRGDSRIKEAQSAVFIQCVGSREPEHPYCSKVCCTHSLKSALYLKELNPDLECIILYRDIRAYGTRETLYQEARSKGVLFVRYDPDHKPRVEKDDRGNLQVKILDHVLGQEIILDADLVGLASAILPQDNSPLAQLCKVPVNEDGFFMEAHAKLRPVDFSTDGIFVAGLAHYPKPIEESITQALAAASRAGVVLSQNFIEAEGVVSHINEEFCRGCGKCAEICTYKAVELITNETGLTVARVNEAVCKGCGPCAVVCPTGAAGLRHFNDGQVLKMLEAALAA